MPFATPARLPGRLIFPGITGRFVHLVRLTCGEVELAAGAIVQPHQHPHEQVTYVLSGRLQFTVGTETQVLETGMCAVIPSGTTHSGLALTACRVLDVFSPARDDFRSAANA
jgi:quercetin dioxygenase-like cupin family protein